MIEVSRLMRSDRACRALLGVNQGELERLLVSFKSALIHVRFRERNDRINSMGAGNPGRLRTSMDKLVFILLYCKVYPTHDVMGFFYSLDRSQSCRWVKKLLPVLEKALGYASALPKRKISSIEEFFQAFPAAKDVFVDGSERPVQKPSKRKARTKTYSGKKKQTTRKIIIITDENKRIGYLSKSKSGRRHDKKIFDKNDLGPHIPPNVTVWADSGFQGLKKQHPNSMIPKKSSKNKPLTEAEKQENKIISGIRITVEHALAGVKRLACMAHIYRNRVAKTDDKFAQIACGLWNFHLQTA